MTPLPRASITSVFVALPSLALLSGCASTAGTGCEEWGTRVESVKVCNSKGMNCTIEEQSVQYCARTKGQRAAPAAAPGATRPQPREAQVAQAPERTVKPSPAPAEQERAAPAPKKIGAANPSPHQPGQARRTQTLDKTGMPNLTPFWRSLFSASRYSGLRYGKVERVTVDPATAPASSTQVEAAMRTQVRAAASMRVASDRKSTPMDHRLAVMVYRAHNREAAVALYAAMMRDEWRDGKRLAQPGVTLLVVKTGDKSNPTGGQRMYVQRGSYVVVVDEWKSIFRDAAGKPVPGKQFAHSAPMSPEVVVKAVTKTFPAE